MAGRRQKHTVDYFPHYVTSGKTLFVLESKFGHVGYSVWFKTLEMLGGSPNHYLDLRDETDLLFLISKFRISKQEMEAIYDMLAQLGAIDVEFWKKRIVYSLNFIENISDAYKRRNNECLNRNELAAILGVKFKKVVTENGENNSKEDKLKKFIEKAKTYSNDYDSKMIEMFTDFWTEPNENGKMKFEFQKTFEIGRRLKSWKRKAIEFKTKETDGDKPLYKVKFG